MAHDIDRREWMATAGALVATALTPLPAVAASSGTLKPPVARVAVVKDTYFGDTLSDPYRWMENDKDPEWLPFLKGQNDYTRSVIDALPNRDKLMKRIQQLSGDIVATSKVQRAGHVSLDWWFASPDGTHIVYGLSKDGSEDSMLHVMNVADGRDLPEQIPNTETAHPHWLDDGSGFFYNQLTGKVDTPERYLDSQVRFHKLGSDPKSDPILMKRGLDANIAFENIQMPNIVTYQGAEHALLSLEDVRPEVRLYIAPIKDILAGHAQWQLVTEFSDEVTAADIHDGHLYLLANKGTPRGRVIKLPVTNPKLANAVEVVPQGPVVIEDFAGRAKDGLFLRIMDGGINRLRRLGNDDKVAEIVLPFDGTIGIGGANIDEPGALIFLSGWLTPTGVWSVSADDKLADTGLTPRPPIDTNPYEAHRFFATAKDGTKIPYSVVHKKGLKLDGRNPTWISAYGSYGAPAYTPFFLGRLFALIDEGAVVGFANVRGGGEYGREWHKAGQLANKPNTWRDLIAVCEELIAKKYTSKEHLAIGGRSAGGITVGRAMTERPDLFAAVVGGVGWFNPLRYVAEQNGYGEEPEWGAIREESGYRALKSIDSYQAVRDGAAYPAALLTTGVTDPRVAPFHIAKMAARLQAATSSGKPILLRVDFDAGHGIGSTRAQQDREAADTYAFLLWQTAAKG